MSSLSLRATALALCLLGLLSPSPPSASADFTAHCEGLATTGLSGVSFGVAPLPDGTYRAYYMGGGMVSATSPDGVSWTKEAGERLTPIPGEKNVTNPWVFQTSDKRYRMIFESEDYASNRTFFSAISGGGLSFSREGQVMAGLPEDTNPQTNATFLSVPAGIRLGDGSLRMYFVSDGTATRSAVSTDEGRTWTRDAGTRLTNAVDPAVIPLSSSALGMFFTDWSQEYRTKRLWFVSSFDGMTFDTAGKHLVAEVTSATESIVDPEVIRTKDGRLRLHFSIMSQTGPESPIYTCLLPPSYDEGGCAATLSPALTLHIPMVDVGGALYRGDLAYVPSQDGSILFIVTGAEAIATGPSSLSCEKAVLSADLSLTVPTLLFGSSTLWATFAYLPSSSGNILFKVTGYGFK